MLKYLLIAVLIIWLFYSPALRGKRTGGQPTRKAEPPRAENMVQCAHCGVHLPEGDAIKDDQGRFYCSSAHRQAGAKRA